VRSSSPRLDPRIVEAFHLAVSAHDGQHRKDGRTPYVVHPVGVLRRLSSDLAQTDADLLCAGLLHDVLEDTETRRDSLVERFGAKVTAIVEELTLPPELHGSTVDDSLKTARLVLDVGRMTPGALLVKLCDRWDNLGDARHARWDSAKCERFAVQTDQIVERVERRIREGDLSVAQVHAAKIALEGIRRARSELTGPVLQSGGRGWPVER
jgi:guanosine-3',5'-bis(diphosphate) 3'-pyrophosphohydrolase